MPNPDIDMYNELLDGVVTGLKLINQREDLFNEVARTIRLTYEAMIRVGFTPTEALEIVSRQGGAKIK